MTDRHNSTPNLWERFKQKFARFMYGRYGTDQLNSLILWVGVGLCVLSMLIPIKSLSLVMTMLAYVCMGIALYRTFSKNTYKRYQENRKYMLLLQRLKDREHRYYPCPQCHQITRVPRGKGKISITCPQCKHKFIKKT